MSHAQSSTAPGIAPDRASSDQLQKLARRARKAFQDFESCDFVSLTLTAMGFALGIYAVSLP